jgi:soluble lytic murein transglycosylase
MALLLYPHLALLTHLAVLAGDGVASAARAHPGPLALSPAERTSVVGGPGASESVVQDQGLAVARAEMARGRFWYAARLLRAEYPEGPRGRPELILLLAEAEAGWGNWPEVRSLLQAPLAAGEVTDPRAWHLLGRSMEAGGMWLDAEGAYTRVLETPEPDDSALHEDTRTRRALVRARLGWFAAALADVEKSMAADSAFGGWLALEVAGMAAETGAREEVRSLLAMVPDDEVRELGWSLPARAMLVAGDSLGAEVAYWVSIPFLSSSADRAMAWERAGSLRLARGDSVGARGAFHRMLELSSGAEGALASQALLGLGFDSLGVALTAAEALARAGRHREALAAYSAHEALLGGVPHSPRVGLARARAHASLREWQRVLELLREVVELEDASVAAPASALRIQALRATGRRAEAEIAEDVLVARFPHRPEAVEVLFLRAAALQSRGDLQGALRGYRETAELAPPQNLAGEARMRMGQILVSLGREDQAAEVFSEYLRMFPDGRRWDEAAFWAGRTLLSLDRVDEGNEILRRLLVRLPISYYALQSGRLLGQPFDPGIPAHVLPLPFPPLLQAGLANVDRLVSVGLHGRAAWEVGRMVGDFRVEEDPLVRQPGLLRLALELNERGFTREGINLGWELRREGVPWSRDLLSAIYPFPHRDLIVAEAEERGLDPFLMAGLIRQESAFWVEARSGADARGLMQLLPGTGAEVARAAGPRDFRPDEHLYLAEINVHLGTAFFADLRRRFGNSLPILLSAYNAGPTRARRWQEFPEIADLPRFVERIPFAETRAYVKAVLLNEEIYRWLYGAKGTWQVASAGGAVPDS